MSIYHVKGVLPGFGDIAINKEDKSSASVKLTFHMEVEDRVIPPQTNIVHYISDSDECKGKKSMKTENNE